MPPPSGESREKPPANFHGGSGRERKRKKRSPPSLSLSLSKSFAFACSAQPLRESSQPKDEEEEVFPRRLHVIFAGNDLLFSWGGAQSGTPAAKKRGSCEKTVVLCRYIMPVSHYRVSPADPHRIPL